MGLENGLILHSDRKIEFPSEIKDYINGYVSIQDKKYHYELCYWRKCWNIRREMSYIISAPLDYVAKFGLDILEVKNLWRALNDLNDKRSWESGESIWIYEEIKDHLTRDLLILEWLIFFMRQHEESEYTVEFYDSY